MPLISSVRIPGAHDQPKKLIAQRLNEEDFRLFPSAQTYTNGTRTTVQKFGKIQGVQGLIMGRISSISKNDSLVDHWEDNASTAPADGFRKSR